MNLLPGKKKKLLDNYARYSSIAFQMLVIILAGVFGGIKLDEWLEMKIPVFTIVFSILSVILAIYTVTKDLIRSGKKEDGKDS
ncbi:MAG TPA: AtpZ/AtpI family protein [Bacteroidales bacterium]|nr:AtpZ/AtpI family protein [Bacteroidales bacterium]HPI85798.1 AtpZ/AtpI family protein [Bacteroidales bacterium]HPM92742.1 AtpZ/AtpI family protein [Bacteroidales bacterium]